MSIYKLPDYVINRLKAGEVVNRPSNVLKELLENSLDAGAKSLEINIKDGGKNLISVSDDGEGIQLSDMDLLFERYATSKIKTDEDLLSLSSYGFRGEALASIAEVSKITVLSKTAYSKIGTKLVRRGGEEVVNHLPVPFQHGTSIMVEDLFYNVPARLKFLKSSQTEFYYCYNYFVDSALWHYDKNFIFKKNDKTIFDLGSKSFLVDRINDIYKKDWSKNLKKLDFSNDGINLSGVVSDSSLRFGSGENIKIYVNSRPIQDKIIYKALMDVYNRQLSPGDFPIVVLMLDVPKDFLDVNVHPSKLQVKFHDSQKVYKTVYDSVYATLGKNKIASVDNVFLKDSIFHKSTNQTINTELLKKDFNGDLFGKSFGKSGGSKSFVNNSFSNFSEINNNEKNSYEFLDSNDFLGDYKILGQLWSSYIIIQSNEYLYYVDQHALAERIAFEKMKKAIDLKKELLLQPIKVRVVDLSDLKVKIDQLNDMGFDCSLLSENVLVIYAVPDIFVKYPVDLEKLFDYILYLDKINYDHIVDGVFATKACKTSIKAGDKLSYDQMLNLIKDGFNSIESMFVCQHGRPFFVKIEKNTIDKLFDR